jgi:hypothetical protein
MCFGLLVQGYWDENVDGRRRCGLVWDGWRSDFLTPSADFADFGDDDVFGFGQVEGEGVPEYVVVVKVIIGVEDSAIAERETSQRTSNR